MKTQASIRLELFYMHPNHISICGHEAVGCVSDKREVDLLQLPTSFLADSRSVSLHLTFNCTKVQGDRFNSTIQDKLAKKSTQTGPNSIAEKAVAS